MCRFISNQTFSKRFSKEIKNVEALLQLTNKVQVEILPHVFEGFSSQNFFPKIISKSLPENYIFENGGRKYLLDKNGLSNKDIVSAAKKI